jgi:hypothetical protein
MPNYPQFVENSNFKKNGKIFEDFQPEQIIDV